MEFINDLRSNKKAVLIIWICCLVVVLGVILFGLNQSNTPSQNSSPTGLIVVSPTSSVPLPSPTPSTTPESITENFYSWYMSQPKDPIASGGYKTNPLLSEYFINLTTEFVQGYTRSEPYDPIFCIKNKTKDVHYGSAQYINKDSANVMIYRKIDNKDLYRVTLLRTNGNWLINDIACRH